MARRVLVFFYGSYMNEAVLAEFGFAPDGWEVATVAGFDLVITPRANLALAPDGLVYGVLTLATHEDLGRLYSEHALRKLGEIYLPEAVLAITAEGIARPALAYIAPDMSSGAVDPAYVDRIAEPAARLGFPEDYVARIRSFSPRPAAGPGAP